MTMTTARDDLYAQAYNQGLRAARSELQQQVTAQLAAQGVQAARIEVRPLPANVETFAPLLIRLRLRVHLSRNRLAHEAGCDPSYLQRIETEQRPPPLRHLVDALARVLFLNPFEYRQFVTAAGYAPVQVWTPELEAAYRGRKA